MTTKNRYYYWDNWYGAKRYHDTLKAAKDAAKKETGIVIYIYREGLDVSKFWTVEASGHTPA